MKIKAQAYFLKSGEDVIYRVVDSINVVISLIVDTEEGYQYFEGPAHYLQMWAAKRNIPYEHVVLKIPVEVFDGL